MSYTTFNYSDLSIQAIEAGDNPADAASVLAWENGNETLLRLLRDLLEPFGIYILIFAIDDPGSLRSVPMIRLHRPAFTVSFTVENSGSVFG